MLRVGLTGGIGSGKSEVARRLAARGAVVIDADRLAREVVAPGTDGLAAVVGAFGEEVLGPDGALDRPALGRRVFAHAESRRRLEEIIHPRVRARAAELERAAVAANPDAVVVHDIPLLVETGQQGGFDEVIVVDVPEELQIDRLTSARGIGVDDARARAAAQASRDERRAAATVVVDNSGSLTDLDVRVEELWRRLRSAASGDEGERRGRDLA
ncbi:dephospho-CoA kinase [Actinopolymorpha singaporensis]|uniref:Dephospho-CoA kinase n=1 Tax=Actinopolymorpha singaporensis TaxID=117157 RepID=A0A1H1WXG1_9ACTN|nr:dephospho-CoA kinase [Actinopolymorpha singaporensis]SDT01843.1 dephospho-CoA kinase [Actinopolymorpha singaporensis]